MVVFLRNIVGGRHGFLNFFKGGLLKNNLGIPCLNGELNFDRLVQALLTQRTTPSLGCKLFPVQILFGPN